MARKSAKKQGESIFTYFRTLFSENRHFLEQTSNDEVIARYRADHNLPEDQPIDKKVRDALANTKSQLRKKFGIEVSRGKGGRKSRKGGKAKVSAGAVAPAGKMATLEEQIDDCMALAKHLGRDKLGDVIRLLRNARNKVVLMRGGSDGQS